MIDNSSAQRATGGLVRGNSFSTCLDVLRRAQDIVEKRLERFREDRVMEADAR